jgi:hypothetical protein
MNVVPLVGLCCLEGSGALSCAPNNALYVEVSETGRAII